MTTLIVGASGATGKQLVDQLLKAGQKLKLIIRSTGNIPDSWIGNENITIIRASITDMSIDEIAKHSMNCEAVASCLGHNLTLKGIYGKPKKLVTDSVRMLCDAIKSNAREKPVKFVLMNTAGNSNRDVAEPVSFAQKSIIGLLRLLLPPHPDNEKAADFLRVQIGQHNKFIDWVVVRPDTLINEDEVTAYTLHNSPTRSAIFNPGKTSRINVANFMCRLITNDDLWDRWQGKMPVIYNDTVQF